MSAKRGVLVTTDATRRGVFFGYYDSPDNVTELTLERARMVVYWPVENHGVLGLAANGPMKGARISPAIPSWTINGVTGVGECTSEAIRKFEGEPWL